MNKILEKVIVYLTKDGAHVINVDEDLFFKGLLDSLGVLEVISIIEEEGGIEFNPEFFIVENFQTINAIEALIISEIND
jgi:acyl carrier protein